MPTLKLACGDCSATLGAMRRLPLPLAVMMLIIIMLWSSKSLAQDSTAPRSAEPRYEERSVHGWKVHIRLELLSEQNKTVTERGLALISAQMEVIEKVVPSKALSALKKVHLWLSPVYPNTPPKAEYHPSAGWLQSHGRNPAMAKGVEFTNVSILEKEVLRMPLLTLHELAHAYHDQVLGHDQPDILAAYKKAKNSHAYDSVLRRNHQGTLPKPEKAYAMSNEKEYFAESTESFFGQNDFYPFNRSELANHDPSMLAVLQQVWGAE